MPVTGLRGRQILDGDVFRNDLNVTSSTQAVVARIVAGTNISIGSSNANMTGTGDVTINLSGTIGVTNGGTGVGTLTGVLIGNGTNAITGVIGTANQLLRRNAGNTAYEFFTHDFLSTSGGTLTGTLIFGNASSPNTHTIQFGDNTGWVLRMMTNVSGTPTQRFAFADNGTFSAVGQIISTKANTTGDGTGQIFLNGTTGNRIDWNAQGVAAPSFTTRSLGTKLVLYPSVNATQVDYALGINSDTMWFSTAVAGGVFNWYGGTTSHMKLIGGDLVLGDIAASGKLTIRGASGGTSLYLTDTINSTIYITHNAGGSTRFFNGTGTQWMQEVGTAVTIGNSTSAPAKFFVYNTNLALPAIFAQNESTLTTLQDSIPLKFTDLYNSGANGHNLFFNSSASSGSWEYNITKTFGGILTFGVSSDGTSLTRQMYLYSSGQLRLTSYTSTSSFSGTAVGVLGFLSDGSIITIPVPSGGSGITGSGTANYITKFTGSTTIGNSQIFDNGTNVGIGTSTPNSTLHILTGSADTTGDAFSFTGVASKTFVSISKLGFIRSAASETNGANIHFLDNTPSKRGELAVNSSIFGWYSDGLAGNFMEWNHLTGQIRFNRYTATNSFTGALIGYLAFTSTGQIITTAAPSGSSQWTTTGTAIVYTGGNVGIGSSFPTAPANILDVRMPTSNNGAIFQSLLSSSVGSTPLTISSNDTWQTIFKVANSTTRDYQIGVTGSSNSTLGGGHFGIVDGPSATYRFSISPTGQIRFQSYTSTSAFSGTALGVLAFTSDGSIIPIATPSGSSQWVTNGSDIYYNTGNVGIGATTPLARLHFSTASTSVSNYIRFTNPVGSIYAGQVSNLQWFEIGIPSGAVWFQLKDTGQARLLQYTAIGSFTTADSIGTLHFDVNGNIQTAPLPIYRVAFVSGAPITLNNVPSAVQFFNNSNSYITRVDMTGKKRARLIGRVTTAATGGTQVRVRYRTIFSTTASDYLQMGASEIQIPISSNGQFESAWIDLVAGAKADVLVALQTIGGDGATDPVVSQIHLEIED